MVGENEDGLVCSEGEAADCVSFLEEARGANPNGAGRGRLASATRPALKRLMVMQCSDSRVHMQGRCPDPGVYSARGNNTKQKAKNSFENSTKYWRRCFRRLSQTDAGLRPAVVHENSAGNNLPSPSA